MARELQAELSPMAEWAQSGSKASVDALMNSWCTRLESLGSLSLGQAMQMKQTIQDLSFESTLSERLLEKVEAKVLATATAATPPPDTTYTPNKRKEESKPQTLLKPENFITVTEWSMLEKSPAPARLEILLKRYLQLGLRNLTEQTVKKGLAFLLALAAGELSQMPTYEEIYEEVQVFKRSWESVKTDAEPTEVGLLTYPDDPSSLPKALFDRAYKAEDPPMGKDVRAGIWLAHIPMRSTSKLLQKNKKQRLPRPDGQAAVSEQHANEFQSRMEQCFGRLERMLDQGCGQNAIQDGGRRELQLAAGASELSSSSAGVGFALGNPAQPVSAATQQTSPGRQSALPLALPPAEEPEATESLPAENDLEDEALFKKLKDRKAGILKKPAAAAAASGQGNLAKNKTKTNGQGQDPKKKGSGKGKGKVQGQECFEERPRQSKGAASPRLAWKAEVPNCLGGRLHPEELCFSHVQASRNVRLLGAASGRVPARGPQRAILLWKKKNGC
ncbi:unnamed protein product [Symbiodinium sp. CCMP2592]|nr:unnamed protein product [Symbiodinium sp. CCMP2592]